MRFHSVLTRLIKLWIALVLLAGLAASVVGVVRFVKSFDYKSWCSLGYANGAIFRGTCNGQVDTLRWIPSDIGDAERPRITIAFDGVELTDDILTSQSALIAMGWSSTPDLANNLVEVYSKQRRVRCWFRNEKLVEIQVSTVVLKGELPFTVRATIDNDVIELPAPRDNVLSVFGKPKWQSDT